MKKILSLALTLILLLGLIPASVMTSRAEGEIRREWLYIEPFGDEVLTGQAARDMLGVAEEDAVPDGGDLFHAPFAYSSSGLDMSVYDAINFGSRTFTMNGSSAVASSAYEAAEFFMHRIMNGTAYMHDGTWGSIYGATFVPNVDLTPSMLNYDVFAEMAYFIRAYFPHSTGVGASYTIQGGHIMSYTLMIGEHVNQTLWDDEYNEAEALMTRDVSGVLNGMNGVTSGAVINSGTAAEKLRKAHDYLAKTVIYDSQSNHDGQPAYTALIEGRAVCNAYALAYSMLCLRMGLNVPYMTGDAGGPHAWNLNLTGYPTFLLTDATWGRIQSPADANGGASSFLGVRQDYYNQPLDGFRSARSWSPYYESYIHYVNGVKDNLAPEMIFSEMAGIGDPGDGVIVPSTTPDNGVINLTSETIHLPLGFTPALYSVNGGTKWVRWSRLRDQRAISRLFDKSLTLWITDKVDAKGKYSASALGTDIKFPVIEGRERRPGRPMAWYTFDIATGIDSWYIIDRSTAKTAPKSLDGWIITEGASRVAVENSWEAFSPKFGLGKKTYLARIPAEEKAGKYYPASRVMRFRTVAKPSKTLNLREKDGEIALRKGWSYQIDSNPVVNLTAKGSVKRADFTALRVWTTPGRKPAGPVASP